MRYFLEIEVSDSEISQSTVTEISCLSADELLELMHDSRTMYYETIEAGSVNIRQGSFTLYELVLVSKVAGASVVIQTKQTELTKQLVGDLNRWPENLFMRVEEVNWGSDGIGTRLLNGFTRHGHIRFVAQALLVFFYRGYYVIPVSRRTRSFVPRSEQTDRDPNVAYRQIRNYGAKSHERLHEMLATLGIDPNMDMTDFPWGLLGRR
ncbi:MAG: hypothetical protein UY76_C0020G0003 [Candidatus Uhrbacteria bacterium GW2011_GWA2_52_8d]|uniref:Uncharacterized protein n=1 Tax=Candidatus Uhrbacteria bacterium GW2011_GWA2_52_8d TaxID=1618979 RepID=A0A0G1XP84_9BACT|nr:MAG: hypothetical protein UY76_C0020G0003 [Candidatus Uhrbacteria bacterium GW2011_GWA2_52_8d]